jgi:low temperature requirement protein LtrA
MGLLLIGSFTHGAVRAALWTVALAIDYAGPAWLTRERLRGLQRVAVAHFAERYSLFVIICLGESIIAIGAASHELNTAHVAVVALGLMITVGMWWTYFDRFAATAEARLREHDDPVLAAADAYSYIHLLIVAGIIIFAVGVKLLVLRHDVASHLRDPARLALCGGVALYLLGNVAFRLRMVGVVGYEKLLAAAALLVLYLVGGRLPAWSVAATITALMAVLCLIETLADRVGVSPQPAREREHEGAAPA